MCWCLIAIPPTTPPPPTDCARYIFTTMLGLCAPAGPRVAPEYRELYAKVGGACGCMFGCVFVSMCLLVRPLSLSLAGQRRFVSILQRHPETQPKPNRIPNLNPTPQDAPDVSTPAGKVALLKRFRAQLAEWGPLLQRFLKSEDDQVGVCGVRWCDVGCGWWGVCLMN